MPAEETYLAIGAEKSPFPTELLQRDLTFKRGSRRKILWIKRSSIPTPAVVFEFKQPSCDRS